MVAFQDDFTPERLATREQQFERHFRYFISQGDALAQLAWDRAELIWSQEG